MRAILRRFAHKSRTGRLLWAGAGAAFWAPVHGLQAAKACGRGGGSLWGLGRHCVKWGCVPLPCALQHGACSWLVAPINTPARASPALPHMTNWSSRHQTTNMHMFFACSRCQVCCACGLCLWQCPSIPVAEGLECWGGGGTQDRHHA